MINAAVNIIEENYNPIMQLIFSVYPSKLNKSVYTTLFRVYLTQVKEVTLCEMVFKTVQYKQKLTWFDISS